jgi:hypothetical protein
MPIELTENPISALVQKMEQDYLIGETTRSKYVTENFYEDLCTIDAYLSSKHTSGNTDSFGRVKPFFNIVLAARNIWFRATDIDRKNIRIKATKAKDYIPSFLATVHLQDYMRRENFGQFLNDWGLVLASYNSAVCKFVEKDGRLHTVVVPWQKLIVDSVDFENNPKIEILEMTEAQLRKNKDYDQEMVEALCQSVVSRETLDKTKKDTKDNYIKLYEVHGELPLSYLTGKEKDEDEYVQQMHIISLVANKENGGFDDYTLYSGREKQDPYLLTSLIKNTDGSISLNGSVKNLFEAQWMTNHSIKAIKDQLDLASMLIFQTSDGKFANQNVLSDIQNGQIMIYAKDQPLTQLANTSHDITALQSFGQQWQVLSQELTSTPDIMKGQNMPSGTAFRQAAIIQQESHSNFEIMTENKGLAIEEMMRLHIIPYLKKQMDTLEDYDITKIDSVYIPNEAVKRFNSKAVEAVINKTELPDLQQEMQGVKQELGALGNQRFFKPSEISTKTWQDVFSDFEWEAIVEITDENVEKQAVMDTLSNVFQTLAQNPMILENPAAKLVFNKILNETSAISPVELSSLTQPTPNMPMNNQQQNMQQMPQQIPQVAIK